VLGCRAMHERSNFRGTARNKAGTGRTFPATWEQLSHSSFTFYKCTPGTGVEGIPFKSQTVLDAQAAKKLFKAMKAHSDMNLGAIKACASLFSVSVTSFCFACPSQRGGHDPAASQHARHGAHDRASHLGGRGRRRFGDVLAARRQGLEPQQGAERRARQGQGPRGGGLQVLAAEVRVGPARGGCRAGSLSARVCEG